jgi:DNA-binding CsgD family transcriptional regulator
MAADHDWQLDDIDDIDIPEFAYKLYEQAVAAIPDDVRRFIARKTPQADDETAGPIVREMAQNMRQAVEAGFVMALARYQLQLSNEPELARFYAQRREGADRGRHTQAQRKADRQRDAHRLLAEGHEVEAIATALGCSLRTVYRLLQSAPPADA